jgi:hypothetical protein
MQRAICCESVTTVCCRETNLGNAAAAPARLGISLLLGYFPAVRPPLTWHVSQVAAPPKRSLANIGTLLDRLLDRAYLSGHNRLGRDRSQRRDAGKAERARGDQRYVREIYLFRHFKSFSLPL